MRFYEGALKDPAGCCAARNPFAASAGYDEQTLAMLPEDAASNSFGCGNPLAFADVKPGQTVLDLGSGAGVDLLLAAEKVGSGGRVIGVDLSEVMIERARANAAAAGLDNVEVRHGAIEDLPVESGSVDWIISNCVINLSPDKARVFRQIHRVLRPGGRMLISDMVVDRLPDWIVSNSDLRSACIAGAIPEKDYLDVVRAAGFDDLSVVDRFTYDDAALRALIRDALPVSLDTIARNLGRTVDATIGLAIAAVRGCVHSLRIAARKPV